MRPGPNYSQHIVYDMYGFKLPPPLELVEELSHFKYVTWTDNRDGTYTLRPYNEDNN